ncbi:MAG: hypothetical protein IT260_22355 [Saprospiraceae bacterium]|nr:hypothetical protein [Saprospiraceae bacterium]
MQTQYSTDELVHLITTNNLTGVYARLAQEGRVSAAMLPNVDAISYAIQEQSGRLSPEAFLAWLEQVLDVPVDQTGLYATELTAIRQTTGKTPARLLTEQIRQTVPQNTVASLLSNGKGRPYLAWILIGLAVIGLLCVLRYLGRILEKAVA